MPVPAIELRPRSPVALLDAAIHLCAQDGGIWTLALSGGALVTAAVFHLTEALRLHQPLFAPSLLLAAAWFARGLCQGAACHYVEHLVLAPTPPSAWGSFRAALARAPSLFIAVMVLAAINIAGTLLTLGFGFFLFTAHMAGYAATMRGVGHPLGLYRTCSRLLGGAAGGGLLRLRLAFSAQILLAFNLHLGANMLIFVGRKLVALDLSFADRYASLDNPGWLLTVAALTFALMEPLRAALAALLLIDGRVRQEGLDLLAALEQLPRRNRPGGQRLAARARDAGAAALLLLCLCLPGLARAQEDTQAPEPAAASVQGETDDSGAPPADAASEDDEGDESFTPATQAPPPPPSTVREAVTRLENVIDGCGGDRRRYAAPLAAARELSDRERDALVRFLSDVETFAYQDGDCDTALDQLDAGLPLIVQARDARVALNQAASADAARHKAKEILSRPEFRDAPPLEKPEPEKKEEPVPDENSLWGRFKRWLRDLLRKLFEDDSRRAPPPKLSLPGSGLGVANVLVIVLGAAAIAVLGFLLFQLRPRRRKVESPLQEVTAGPDAVGPDGQNALSRPPEGWASLADQLAARGEFREAVRSLYLALLSRLHREGAIDYDPAQSNWEYFRRFRGPREWVPPFRELTTRFDYAWYGNLGADPEGYQRFRELSGPLLSNPAQPATGAPLREAPRA